MSSFNPWPHISPVSASSPVPPYLPLNPRESTSSVKTETLQLLQDFYTEGQSTRLSVHLSVYAGDTCCPLGRLNSARSILMSQDCREGTILKHWWMISVIRGGKIQTSFGDHMGLVTGFSLKLRGAQVSQSYEGLKYRHPLVTTWDRLLDSPSDTKTQVSYIWKKV